MPRRVASFPHPVDDPMVGEAVIVFPVCPLQVFMRFGIETGVERYPPLHVERVPTYPVMSADILSLPHIGDTFFMPPMVVVMLVKAVPVDADAGFYKGTPTLQVRVPHQIINAVIITGFFVICLSGGPGAIQRRIYSATGGTRGTFDSTFNGADYFLGT